MKWREQISNTVFHFNELSCVNNRMTVAYRGEMANSLICLTCTCMWMCINTDRCTHRHTHKGAYFLLSHTYRGAQKVHSFPVCSFSLTHLHTNWSGIATLDLLLRRRQCGKEGKQKTKMLTFYSNSWLFICTSQSNHTCHPAMDCEFCCRRSEAFLISVNIVNTSGCRIVCLFHCSF